MILVRSLAVVLSLGLVCTGPAVTFAAGTETVEIVLEEPAEETAVVPAEEALSQTTLLTSQLSQKRLSLLNRT